MYEPRHGNDVEIEIDKYASRDRIMDKDDSWTDISHTRRPSSSLIIFGIARDGR